MSINFNIVIKRSCSALGLNVDNNKVKLINSVGLEIILVTINHHRNQDQLAVGLS